MPGLPSATGQVSTSMRGDVRPAVLVEMLNPVRLIHVPLANLTAIHAVAGVLRREEYCLAPTTPRAAE